MRQTHEDIYGDFADLDYLVYELPVTLGFPADKLDTLKMLHVVGFGLRGEGVHVPEYNEALAELWEAFRKVEPHCNPERAQEFRALLCELGGGEK